MGSKARRRTATKPVLLSGGNPQIPKADGDAPVQAYVRAMPGWKREAGRRLDALIERTIPDVQKCIRWNSPFYGVDGQGWFLSYHCFTRYIKVTFLRGTALRPLPPVGSKDPNARYVHIDEDEPHDEAQLADWIRQAAALPGWDFGSELQPLAPAAREAPGSAARAIDARIRDLGDWRGSVLQRIRELIHEAEPDVVEEFKWKKKSSPGTPVWSRHGGICTGETYKEVVKLTFFHGASLKDPAGLFNASLAGNTRRAIDIRKDDTVPAGAFRDLVRAAVRFNDVKRRT